MQVAASHELSYADYEAREPRLARLWALCERAAPPVRAPEDEDDDDETFLEDVDPADGWCAEDFFCEQVKPLLAVLVGIDRADGPAELQTSEAYRTVYVTLLHRALRRSCACCRDRSDH